MFNGKSFNEKFLLMRKYYDFACAINCTRKLTCVCACTCTCDYMCLREQYALTAQIIKIKKKMKKAPGDIIILHMWTKNYDQIM